MGLFSFHVPLAKLSKSSQGPSVVSIPAASNASGYPSWAFSVPREQAPSSRLKSAMEKAATRRLEENRSWLICFGYWLAKITKPLQEDLNGNKIVTLKFRGTVFASLKKVSLKHKIMAVLKVVELLSDSSQSWEDAVKTGVQRASQTLKNVRSAYVKDQSVTVENGQITTYRVVLKI